MNIINDIMGHDDKPMFDVVKTSFIVTIPKFHASGTDTPTINREVFCNVLSGNRSSASAFIKPTLIHHYRNVFDNPEDTKNRFIVREDDDSQVCVQIKMLEQSDCVEFFPSESRGKERYYKIEDHLEYLDGVDYFLVADTCDVLEFSEIKCYLIRKEDLMSGRDELLGKVSLKELKEVLTRVNEVLYTFEY